MTDILKCGICELILNGDAVLTDKISTSCGHNFHTECWNKMFAHEEDRLEITKDSRINLWLALECPVCQQDRCFLDGNAIDNKEYISMLIHETSKYSNKCSKCIEEIEVLEEKMAMASIKHKKMNMNYSKMTEYIAIKVIEAEEGSKKSSTVLQLQPN